MWGCEGREGKEGGCGCYVKKKGGEKGVWLLCEEIEGRKGRGVDGLCKQSYELCI